MSNHGFLGQKLREYSVITWAAERTFWALHQLSPSRLIRRSREAHVKSEAFRRDPHGSTVRRARRVEAYVLAWFLIELAILASSANELALPFWIPRSLMIVRILDIFQQSVNMSVFDQLRTDEKLVISSAVRTLVLSFLNYIELIVCFGILYTTFPNTLIGSHTWFDDIYFSVATQLTIGYGDIRPIGWARVVCVSQGIISVAFTILILGRIVSVLPKIDSVMRQTGESRVRSRKLPD